MYESKRHGANASWCIQFAPDGLVVLSDLGQVPERCTLNLLLRRKTCVSSSPSQFNHTDCVPCPLIKMQNKADDRGFLQRAELTEDSLSPVGVSDTKLLSLTPFTPCTFGGPQTTVDEVKLG